MPDPFGLTAPAPPDDFVGASNIDSVSGTQEKPGRGRLIIGDIIGPERHIGTAECEFQRSPERQILGISGGIDKPGDIVFDTGTAASNCRIGDGFVGRYHGIKRMALELNRVVGLVQVICATDTEPLIPSECISCPGNAYPLL